DGRPRIGLDRPTRAQVCPHGAFRALDHPTVASGGPEREGRPTLVARPVGPWPVGPVVLSGWGRETAGRRRTVVARAHRCPRRVSEGRANAARCDDVGGGDPGRPDAGGPGGGPRGAGIAVPGG